MWSLKLWKVRPSLQPQPAEPQPVTAEIDTLPEDDWQQGPAAIYDRCFGFVWRNLRRMGVPPEALDDATQDVFVVVHRRWHEFERRSSIETWLFGIVLRVARGHRRSAQRRANRIVAQLDTPGMLADDFASPTAPDPLRELEQREASATLQHLLNELDEPKRAVFVLMEVERMSAPEVADATGIKLNTVYSRLRAARQELERNLTRLRRQGDV